MGDEKWWKRLKPLRIASNWKVMWNKLEDIEPDYTDPDHDAWLFIFLEDIVYIITEYTYKKDKKTIKRTLAIDLGWYPDGDIKGSYRLVAILDDHWNKPILELKTRSTQEVVDTMELWMFETFADWKNTYPEDKEETI